MRGRIIAAGIIRACLGRTPVRAALLALIAVPTARAQPAPDATLYLRIETGRHEAIINHAALLPDGTGLVTASDDKTIRLWSADTLAARSVLRPPIGSGDEGAVYAVAASGTRVVAGGRIRDADNSFAILFYNLTKPGAPGAIHGLPQPVTALRFSPSGGMLAAGMVDGGGVISYDLNARHPVVHDHEYHGQVTGLDFDGASHLVVAGDDGAIRLYGADGKRIASKPLPNHARPFGVAFSPDGKLIAVGDQTGGVVHLLDATTLAQVKELHGAPQRQGGLQSVAFSPDGHTLYAAGSYKDITGHRYLRHWDIVRPTEAAEFAVAADTVTEVLPIGADVLFTTAEPAIGRIDPTGRVTAAVRSHHLDLRNAGISAFGLSADGTVLEIPTAQPKVDGSGRVLKPPTILFDVRARAILPPGASVPKLALPFGTAGGLSVTEWQNGHLPRANGHLVKLEPDETARAASVAANGSFAVIGTDFHLLFVNRMGETQSVVTPAPVWAVNISSDGRIVVAGLGDGSIRWYRASDQTQLLGLFIDSETRRFVLWTPDGFFDHDRREDGQADGRSLIGYAFNTAAHRASEFVQIGQLYAQFYRPDLVGLKFADQPVGRRIVEDQRALLGSVAQVLSAGLPGRVELLAVCGREPGDPETPACPPRESDTVKPADLPDVALRTSASSVLVQYRLVNQGGVPGAVIARRDDAVLAPNISIEQTAEHSRTEHMVIALGDGLNTIQLTPLSVSQSVEGVGDAVAAFKVLHVPPPTPAMPIIAQAQVGPAVPSASAPPHAEPNPTPPPGGVATTATPAGPSPPGRNATGSGKVTLHLVSIGISDYAMPAFHLANAAADAMAVETLMETPTPPVFGAVDPSPPLRDGNATAANIIAALKHVADTAGPDDLVLIFIAAHGEAVDGKYYLAPVEFGTGDEAALDRIRTLAQTDPVGAGHLMDALLRKEGVSQDQILEVIKQIKAARVALILDTCFSGTIATQDAVLRNDINAMLANSLGYATGRFVLSSAVNEAEDAAPDTVDATPGAAQHGVFTGFLLRALQGAEKNEDKPGFVNIYTLATYTRRNVERATAQGDQVQHPSMFFSGNDFFDVRVAAKPN